jgi:hypothetical protein
MFSLGETFLISDFAWAMFKHLQTHTENKEREVKCYEYNKGVDCEAQVENRSIV